MKPNASSIHLEQQYCEGCELIRNGKTAEALGVFNNVIQQDECFAEAYFQRGVCHCLQGSYRQASRDLDAAALLGCQLAQIWSRRDAARSESSGARQQ